jgi:hypothetical protein
VTDPEIGTAIVSYIEPAPGHARDFNRWYERDHFPTTVLAGPGVCGGGRFVATRACKAARPPDALLFGDPARGSYLGVAWVLAGKQREWDAWVGAEMDAIAAAGRLFPHREHVHTAVYRWVSSEGPVPPIVAFARGFAGVIAIASTGDGDDGRDVAAGAPLAVGLELERTIVSAADPPAHALALVFCDRDPLDTFVRSRPRGKVAFASPFVATIPGTDAHTEEL